MNTRKPKLVRLVSGLTAVLCSAAAIPFVPGMTQTAAAEVVYDGFEQNYDGWHGSDTSVTVTALTETGYAGSRGMVVTDRTSAAQGAASSKGLYLFGGVSYTYRVEVMSETDETFHLTLRTIDEKTGEETIRELSSKQVKADTWTALSATYTAPADSYEFELMITTDSTADFRFDEVQITTMTDPMQASAAQSDLGLKDEFAGYFRVGNILNGGTIQNSGITGNILKDCNAIECENETKPDATLVQNGSTNTNIKVSLDSCAAIADFAIQNNLAFRGHTMVWHSQTPSWFFKENYSLYYFTAYHLLGDEELSRDMVGESVELLWRNCRDGSVAEWRSFLYTTLRNKCIDYLRHQEVRKKYVAFYLAMTPEEVEENDEEEERMEMLIHRLDALPPLPRRVLDMCYFERKRYQEVAVELGISSSYVKKLMMKALKLLREG